MQGLKPGQIKALERLYKRRFPADAVHTPEQAKELALLSRSLNRQIGLLIDRKGKVRLVVAGEAGSIYIPELPYLAGGGRKLRGWRLLHTHLSSSGLDQEDLMDMLFLRLDAAISLTVKENGDPDKWQAAWLAVADTRTSSHADALPYVLREERQWHDAALNVVEIAEGIDRAFGRSVAETGANVGEIAFLVSVSTQPQNMQERNLDELAELAETAGLQVGGRLVQRIAAPNPRFILGKGKLAELEVKALDANAEILIFDGELSPAQLHNLADVTERKVLDRTQLILDIFAQHAMSKAGKLQVELAQLAYAQPRLAGKNRAFDRLMGGIGGRGPGESKLETDRRASRERMAVLKRELENLRRQRSFVRNRRQRNGIPLAALVGYTNAGKSTLLNTLTSSGVPAADRMFATLDPATRRLRFPREREIVLSDTVGFIRNLPKELMEAFRATLEELQNANLLLHVADAGHPELLRQVAAVESILDDLELGNSPRLLVLNKCDQLPEDELESLKQAFPGAIAISATERAGLDALLKRIEDELFMGQIGSAGCNKARGEHEEHGEDE